MSIHIKELKKGQVVYECEYGQNIRLTVTEDGHRKIDENHNGWAATATTDKGNEIELFVDHKITAYGPRLYDAPAYATWSSRKTPPQKFQVQYKLEPR